MPYVINAKAIAINGHSLGASHSIILTAMILNAGFKVDQLYLFAPPRTGDKHLIEYIQNNVEIVKAYINGFDPIPHFPLGAELSQFPLIQLHEPPENNFDPIQWHMIEHYIKGVDKLND